MNRPYVCGKDGLKWKRPCRFLYRVFIDLAATDLGTGCAYAEAHEDSRASANHLGSGGRRFLLRAAKMEKTL
jgi:hypothetical protein